MTGRIDAAIRIPDGRLATAEEMRECGRSLQRFVCETEAQLPAMADSRAHDRVVDFLREIAARYNAQVRILRELAARRAEHHAGPAADPPLSRPPAGAGARRAYL